MMQIRTCGANNNKYKKKKKKIGALQGLLKINNKKE